MEHTYTYTREFDIKYLGLAQSRSLGGFIRRAGQISEEANGRSSERDID